MIGARNERPCGCVMDGAVRVIFCDEHKRLATCSAAPPSADATDEHFALEVDPDDQGPT